MSQMVLKPVITEKSLMQAGQGTYVFVVPMSANKLTIAEAVKTQFKVDPTDVRVSIAKGKLKRFKQIKGRRVDTKKAYVTLTKGQSIAAFNLGQEGEVKTKVRSKNDKDAKASDRAKRVERADKQKAEKK